MRLLFFALAITLIFSGRVSAQPAPSVTADAGKEIWFSPRQHWRPGTGINDWNSLFESDAQWPKSSAAVKVFVITEGVILTRSDDELKTMAKFFVDHHIEIALETSVISRPSHYPKPGGEGYVNPLEIRSTAQRLTKLGITLNYLRMDEPIWFGHYDKNDSYTDQLTIPDLVAHIKEVAQEVITPFPDIKIVDIDTIPPLTMQPDWKETYLDYKKQLEAALGKPFTSIQVDLQWHNPAWKTDVKTLSDLAHSLGLKFGVIYNSDDRADDDRSFIAGAEHGFTVVESELNVIPEQPIFQSWEPKVPSHALPETDPTAHTYLIARYLLPRTKIMAQRATDSIQGQVVDETGQPVAGATVSMRAPTFDPAQAVPPLSVTGTVPAKAVTALLGIRVNTECLCNGDNDFVVGKFNYQESGSGTVAQTVDYPNEVEHHPPANFKGEIETIGGQPMAHLVVPSGKTLGFNSPAFSVTPGAAFTLSAPADLLAGDGLFGKVMIIWFDDKKQGFHADDITVSKQYADAGSAVTGADGHFSIPLPANRAGAAGPLHLNYAGSPTLRPAIAILQ